MGYTVAAARIPIDPRVIIKPLPRRTRWTKRPLP